MSFPFFAILLSVSSTPLFFVPLFLFFLFFSLKLAAPPRLLFAGISGESISLL